MKIDNAVIFARKFTYIYCKWIFFCRDNEKQISWLQTSFLHLFFIFRKITQLRDGHSLPPSDNLIRFIMESTYEDFPSCANCDRNEKSQMFFCNTCGKSTCNFCLTQIYYIHQPTTEILKVPTSFFAKSGSLYLYGPK